MMRLRCWLLHLLLLALPLQLAASATASSVQHSQPTGNTTYVISPTGMDQPFKIDYVRFMGAELAKWSDVSKTAGITGK
jgi:ABC-type sugar transport system substrate-binding protein